MDKAVERMGVISRIELIPKFNLQLSNLYVTFELGQG
jgi:hypothetical protein